MKPYRFVVQKNGARVEELGTMSLADDSDALAFAEGIARDMANNQDRNAGRSIAILNGTRTVRSIPLK